jgi:hypothetical protein
VIVGGGVGLGFKFRTKIIPNKNNSPRQKICGSVNIIITIYKKNSTNVQVINNYLKNKCVEVILRIDTIRSSGPASLKETGKELARIRVTFNEAGPEDLIVSIRNTLPDT